MRMNVLALSVTLCIAGAGNVLAGEAPPDMSGYLPMSPGEIRSLMKEYDAVEQAKRRPLPDAVTRIRTIKTIDLTRGPSAEVATVALGYGTTIIAVGENGEPWPIANILPGDSSAISAQPLREKNSMAGVIHVKKPWVSTNLTLDLEGRPEPAVIYLRTTADPTQGQHSIIRVKVPGNAPGTQPLPVRNIAVADDALTNTLSWSPGRQWKEIPLRDGELPFHARLWEHPAGGRYILRLTAGATLRSPNWIAQERSADGLIHVYEFSKRPVLMVATNSDGIRYNIYTFDPVVALANGKTEQYRKTTATDAVREVAAIQRETGPMPSVTRGDYRTRPYDSSYQASGLQLRGKKTAWIKPADTEGGKSGSAAKPKGKSAGATKTKPASVKSTKKVAGVPIPESKPTTKTSGGGKSAAKAKSTQVARKPAPRRNASWELKSGRLSTLLRTHLEKERYTLVWKPSIDYDVTVPIRVSGTGVTGKLEQLSGLYGLPMNVCQANRTVVVYPEGTPGSYMTCGASTPLAEKKAKKKNEVVEARENIREQGDSIFMLEERGNLDIF